ncbi:hypothetical protein INR49_028583 [Caranx melampygus]|nr:hypothetical protein INR49_028583 [Caranx melampygus]
MADTIADTRRLFTKPQNLNDAYGPPSNFLEIDVSNPETIGVGRGRYTTYEVRLKFLFRARPCPRFSLLFRYPSRNRESPCGRAETVCLIPSLREEKNETGQGVGELECLFPNHTPTSPPMGGQKATPHQPSSHCPLIPFHSQLCAFERNPTGSIKGSEAECAFLDN